ncbi:glycoside hydrolase family 88 protein [Paraflavitalea sp. CAU 1676]|uniref:glycoside hydrolase family 88/105 protein n=1 Tax=Paraflavitalea sp. CAU 1676 TaxID=3032598 RepID=UPI0023DA3A01|nr:glycoside hydrolase family 88 protein [Paraflavitalea sp. CAU 1676]MDF2192582.1 glycoside hydrolase family 88 protein [Paraflavitalea sp. CAU 1676]
MKQLFLMLAGCVSGLLALGTPPDTSVRTPKDDYWTAPQAPYAARKALYLQYCAANDQTGGRDGVFSQIARLELRLPVNEDLVREGIAFVYTGKDCNDFTIGGMVRLLYLNKQRKALSASLVKDIEKCLLDFKYWWDEPLADIQYRCYHTENHQGLYHSNELLAGQLLADSVFRNGKSGLQHQQHALERLERWMQYRSRFGFSEWLSNAYYDVELMILTNLHDFAASEALRKRAGLLLDMLTYDMAVNNYRGVFGSTHGRGYSQHIRGGRVESTSPSMKILFGVGVFHTPVSLGAVSLATSDYRCPSLIENIATDYVVTLRSRQRQSIEVADAAQYGLKYEEELTTHLFWGMQEFIHPQVVRMSKQLSEQYNTWPYKNYEHYIKQYDQQVQQHGRVVNNRLDRFALSEANIETYRTPHYMLSSVQDYRKGAVGYQQHIWQATLGVDAVVFTNSPGSKDPMGVCPNFWAGNVSMPRTVQHKNVLISIYRIPAKASQPYSHAYFPRAAFEEVVEQGSWVFARKDSGYLALYAAQPMQWMRDTAGALNEWRALTPDNSWICEMGSQKEWKTFAAFVKAIGAAIVVSDTAGVQYHSPRAGVVSVGWEAPFVVNGVEQSLSKYPRFENQYSMVAFDAPQVSIKKDGQELVLDFASGERQERVAVRDRAKGRAKAGVGEDRSAAENREASKGSEKKGVLKAGRVEAQGGLTNWPKGFAPQEVGRRLIDRFIATPHTNFGMPGPPGSITYSEVCTWLGALRVAGTLRDKRSMGLLEERFKPLLYAKNKLQPRPDHVDHTVFGTVPLELYRQTGNTLYRDMGLWFADEQWKLPANALPEYSRLLDNGYSWQTRLWIDDMFMITAIQSQAYRVTQQRSYIDRAAHEMILYLDSIQRPNGLFYHAADVPVFWGRGNGWMAAGMTELLKALPKDNANRPRILAAYRTMMATLKDHQRADGMWGQLVDDPQSWAESSCTGMFAYALITGVKQGWLDKKTYEPVARKAWLALVTYIDEQGDVREVCEGTNKKNDRQFYLDRRRITGDMHGQAPVLWCVAALL